MTPIAAIAAIAPIAANHTWVPSAMPASRIFDITLLVITMTQNRPELPWYRSMKAWANAAIPARPRTRSSRGVTDTPRARPNPAFSNVAVVSGSVRTIYVGGQDAVDAEGNIVGVGDIAAQTEQVLRNLRTALAAAGAGPEHVVKWTVLIVDGQDFRAGYAAFQREWGDRTDPPVITAAFVTGLAHPDFLVEMDAIAVVPS